VLRSAKVRAKTAAHGRAWALAYPGGNSLDDGEESVPPLTGGVENVWRRAAWAEDMAGSTPASGDSLERETASRDAENPLPLGTESENIVWVMDAAGEGQSFLALGDRGSAEVTGSLPAIPRRRTT
jgi:hypothetical protein